MFANTNFKQYNVFLSSLIIHQVKTKEIIKLWQWSGNVILISIYFTILFLRLLLSFSFDWEDIWNTWKCFITFPNTLNFVKNTQLHVVFSTLFLVYYFLNVYPMLSWHKSSEFNNLTFDKCVIYFDRMFEHFLHVTQTLQSIQDSE